MSARGPWALLVTVAAACLAVTVSFSIYDPDLWQHLAVGRYLWQTHTLPHTQIWTWPTYGAPALVPSWLFRGLLWPFYALGGISGIDAWRWLTTLAAFAILWAVARRMGARGPGAVLVLLFAGLTWRQRTMARPETLAAILLALELLILETRRRGRRDGAWGLVPLLWVWVQAHVSFVLGFGVLLAYLVDAAWSRARSRADPARDTRRGPRAAVTPQGLDLAYAGPGRLALVGVLAAAAAFFNPYLARQVWEPFDFFLHQRHEPLFRTINELAPLDWVVNLRNGLPLLIVGWPVLALVRAVRRGADLVELLLCAGFTALALGSRRFVGTYALVAAPFVARDLAKPGGRAAGRASGPRRADDPVTAGAPLPLSWGRATLFAMACIAICIPEWMRPELPLGLGVDLRNFPVAACDFMQAHDVRGRGFNYFYHGGYLLWRFGPVPGRLPFIDVHQSGTPAIRLEYLLAFSRPDAWAALDAHWRFDWLLLWRKSAGGDHALDFADADTAFAPVFLDDDAALYVRRAGALAAVAESFAYHEMPGGSERLDPLGRACESDSSLRARTRAELERAIASSPRHAWAASLLANLAMLESRWSEARRLLIEARAIDPETPLVSKRLALIAQRDSIGAAGGR